MQHKVVIFVVISVLVVALVYSSFTPFIVFSLPPQSTTSPKNCAVRPDGLSNHCCWDVPFLNSYLTFCQGCRKTETGFDDCDPVYRKSGPAPPLKGGGVLEQPPIQGIAPQGVLPQEGVLEQEPTDEVAEKEVCQHGTSPTGACYPPPKCPAGTELIAGLCRVPEAARGGVLEQLEQGEGASPPFLPGFLERQQLQPPPAEQGAAELPPPTEGTQPTTAEEEQPVPVCQEGLEFNEELGFCVLTECPEGQELNEETGICVLEEQPAAAEEPQEQPTEEPTTEEDQPSEESGSEDGNN